jgi:hypothetical protein
MLSSRYLNVVSTQEVYAISGNVELQLEKELNTIPVNKNTCLQKTGHLKKTYSARQMKSFEILTIIILLSSFALTAANVR